MPAARHNKDSSSLREYRRKRDFQRTAEPAGKAAKARAPSAGMRFVVQKHAARNLHYDFRLEHEGVLKSWAVPKGPSLDPEIKRLAMQVEDHPIEYLDFEGTIPKGEYGGGTVMVWDIGTWKPIADLNEGFKRGSLKFELHGKRLRGNWALFRISRSGDGSESSKAQWLLKKERGDRWARPLSSDDDGQAITDQYQTSAISRRKMESIAGSDRTWSSNRRAEVTASSSATKLTATAAAVRITNPDRVVYPEAGITKGDVAKYFGDVARWMLPQVAGRPLSVLRCPEGRGKPCFVQKHPHAGYPKAIRTATIREKSGSGEYIYVDDVEGLVSLVQMGAMEVHPWGSRIESLEFADYLVFDLDPGPGVTWKRIVKAAQTLRSELKKLGLQTFARTSGGKGLHVLAPLMSGVGWEQAKDMSKNVAHLLALRQPDEFIDTMTKSKRSGRIYIDYLRNSRGATSVASYSPRAREGAPVATPITWSELARLKSPQQFTIATIRSRLSRQRTDPWEGFTLPKQRR